MLLKLYFIFLFSIDPEIQSNVIRFSTGKHTSSEDIENVGSIITSILTEKVWFWYRLSLDRKGHFWFESISE